MTDSELMNRIVYVLVLLAKILLAAAVAGIYAGTMPGFREGDALSGQADAIAGALALAGYSLTTWLDANRARIGSGPLAHDVDHLRAEGVSRKDMRVVTDEQWKLIQHEIERLERIKPLRDAANADEALERQARG